MTHLAFSVPCDPRGKGRPRATTRGGFASLYTDAQTRKYEAMIKAAAVDAMDGRAPLEGPLTVALRFRYAVPPSFTKRRRAAVLALQEPYFGAFDADNLAKSVLDAMNGVVFVDDRQVLDLMAMKRPWDRAGVDIDIRPFESEAGQ